jgi:putative tricarboxylic transport membrane protein
VFFQRPMSLVLILVILAVLLLPRLAKYLGDRKQLRAVAG